jgi:hypothetical protein
MDKNSAADCGRAAARILPRTRYTGKQTEPYLPRDAPHFGYECDRQGIRSTPTENAISLVVIHRFHQPIPTNEADPMKHNGFMNVMFSRGIALGGSFAQ